MNDKEMKIFIEQIQALIQSENSKLENSLETKIGNIEIHNKQHQLISKYDEIFNDETMGILRIILVKTIEKEKKKKQFNDWAMKTVVGSITIGILGFVYTIGSYVLANLSKILG